MMADKDWLKRRVEVCNAMVNLVAKTPPAATAECSLEADRQARRAIIPRPLADILMEPSGFAAYVFCQEFFTERVIS